MWGLLLLAIVGAIAVRGDDATRWHPLVATAYGVGVALIVDEYALLLNLQDVYWAKQGKLSIDIAIGLVALGATFLRRDSDRAAAAARPPARTKRPHTTRALNAESTSADADGWA